MFHHLESFEVQVNRLQDPLKRVNKVSKSNALQGEFIGVYLDTYVEFEVTKYIWIINIEVEMSVVEAQIIRLNLDQ